MSFVDGLEIAVIVPCFNEAAGLDKVVRDFRASLPSATVYVYDNNSPDDTAAVATPAGAEVRRETRRGKGNVVRRMFTDIEADIYETAQPAYHCVKRIPSRAMRSRRGVWMYF